MVPKYGSGSSCPRPAAASRRGAGLNARLHDLRVAQVGAAVGADLAVGPGLCGQPRRGIGAVLDVVFRDGVAPLGLELAAHVLYGDDEALTREEARGGVRATMSALVVGRADQTTGSRSPASLRDVEVGREPHAVAHRHPELSRSSTSNRGAWLIRQASALRGLDPGNARPRAGPRAARDAIFASSSDRRAGRRPSISSGLARASRLRGRASLREAYAPARRVARCSVASSPRR